MASMLRLLRHLKPVIPLITQLKAETWIRLAIQRTGQSREMLSMSRCLTTRAAQRKLDSDFDRGRTLTGGSKMDRLLNQMDSDARRSGRILITNILDIMKEVNATGNITSTQSLLLIRCCGSLVPEELPEYRTQLVNKVMELIKSANVALDISHYNALLKVHLENEHVFSPTEFLNNMESKKIEPNRVTYQRLISFYCQRGDINGASKILEFMKSKNIPINENVFNALIQGHSKSNDMESAKSILGVMKTAKLEPTSDSYLSLICGYAERGNIEEINKILSEAEANDAALLDRDLLEVVYTLAVNGHSQHVDQIITRLKKQFGYNQDVINLVYRLTIKEQEDVAFKLILTMPRSPSNELPAGQFFIRTLVKAGRPTDKILNYCEELKRQNLNTVGLLRATESALVLNKPDYALKFIGKLTEQGFPIRLHYFWPILVSYKNDSSKIHEILEIMGSMNCSPNFDTLLDYVYPNVNLEDPDDAIQKLKSSGTTVGLIVNALVTHFVMQKKLNTAVKLVRTYPVRLIGAALLPHLSRAAIESRDLTNALVILQKLNTSNEEGQKFDFNGSFLEKYYKSSDFNSQKLEELLVGFRAQKFAISKESAEFVRRRFKGEVPKSIDDLLNELSTSEFSERVPENGADDFVPEDRSLSQRDMSLQDLENLYVELKAKNSNARGVLRRLFMAYCRTKNLKKAEEIKAELDAVGFNYSAAMYATLMEVYISNENLEKAMECMKSIYEADQHFPLDDSKILNLAALLIKKGRHEDAVRYINEHYDAHGIKHKTEELLWSSWRVLNAAADTTNPEVVDRFSELLFSKGFAIPSNTLLGSSIKVHLAKNDLEGALRAFENCCKRYNCTPWKNEMLMHYIKLEDADRLQKVVDLSSEIHGEMNTMYDLAYAFISNNQFKQAKKILETPGLRARQGRLLAMCERFIDFDQIGHLEQLVSITKDLFDIDRDEMFFQLLRGYAKINDPDKALGVWTTIQEESTQPRNRTLVYIATILKKNNRPVPFAIPKNELEASSIVTDNPNADINTLIQDNKIDEVLQYRKTGDLTIRQTSFIIGELLKQERLNEAVNIMKESLLKKQQPFLGVLKSLLTKMASAGDVEGIHFINDNVAPETRRNLGLSNFITRAYINSNRSDELLKWLEDGYPENQMAFPNRGILNLLKNSPEFTDRVLALSQAYATKNYLVPLNMMWVHFFTQENYEKADSILKSTPRFNEKLIFIDVVREARDTKNETMARKLIDVIKASQLNEQLKCTTYCGLIDIFCDKTQFDDALKTFEEAVNSGLNPASFKETTLGILRNGLEKQGVAIPKSLANVKVEQEESSDSSSDSSDDEKAKRR